MADSAPSTPPSWRRATAATPSASGFRSRSGPAAEEADAQAPGTFARMEEAPEDVIADVDAPDAYLSKSAEAGRMGKAVEHLVAAACIISTRGQLNVSTSLVDDEGVDLFFHRRDSARTLAVQVKSRMSDSKRLLSGTFIAFVRDQTFAPRPDLDMLFVAVDVPTGAYTTAWLVPSEAFAAGTTISGQGRRRFYASLNKASTAKWSAYRLTPAELPQRILSRLAELDPGPVTRSSGSGSS